MATSPVQGRSPPQWRSRRRIPSWEVDRGGISAYKTMVQKLKKSCYLIALLTSAALPMFSRTCLW